MPRVFAFDTSVASFVCTEGEDALGLPDDFYHVCHYNLLDCGLFYFFKYCLSVAFAIGGFSFNFVTLFIIFYIVAVFVPRESSARSGTIFFSFRSALFRAMLWVFGS